LYKIIRYFRQNISVTLPSYKAGHQKEIIILIISQYVIPSLAKRG
jgi:hypothetical protein